MSLDKNTLKSAGVDVASGGHLVAKALKTEGVWILISALAGKLSLKITIAPTSRSRLAQPSSRLPIPGANELSTVE